LKLFFPKAIIIFVCQVKEEEEGDVDDVILFDEWK